MDQNTNPPQEGQTIQGPTATPTAGGTAAKIPKNTYFLFLDPAGGTSYDNVVCLVNFNFAGTTATNDAGTMCGPDSSPGDLSSSVTFSGQTFLNPVTGEISAPDIFDLWNASTTVGWKIGPATGTSGDMIKEGQ